MGRTRSFLSFSSLLPVPCHWVTRFLERNERIGGSIERIQLLDLAIDDSFFNLDREGEEGKETRELRVACTGTKVINSDIDLQQVVSNWR